MKLHHITFEVEKTLIADEERFWGLLGFQPTGLRRRSRKQPPIHWLVSSEGTAIELIPTIPRVDLAHICFVDGNFDLTIRKLFEFSIRFDEASAYFGFKRAFVHSPGGHTIELLSGSPSIKAGPPLEET